MSQVTLAALIALVPNLDGAAQNEIDKMMAHVGSDAHETECKLKLEITLEPDKKVPGNFRAIGTVQAVFPKLVRVGDVAVMDGVLVPAKLDQPLDPVVENQTKLDLDGSEESDQ